MFSLKSKPSAIALGFALIAGCLSLGGPSIASDHQDSPLMVSRPGADITDVFIFPAADPSKVVLAMDVHPLIPAGTSAEERFDPGVMYQFKIAHGKNGYVEDQVIQFKATGTGADQQITMYGPGTPSMRGTRSQWIAPYGSAPLNTTTKLPNGVMLFAGARRDPFYFDLAQFFKIIPDRNYAYHPNVPAPSANCFRTPGVDFLRRYDVLSLIVELPRTMLADSAHQLTYTHLWATTSIAGSAGSYTQVERLARPAVKEATESFADHDITNRSTPTNDSVLSHSIYHFAKTTAHRSDAVANALVKVLIPDEIMANLAAKGPARYLAVETNGKSGLPVGVVRAVPPAGIEGIKRALGDPYRDFGGRDPSSPVIDLSLGAIFGSIIPKVGLSPDDHQETACLTSDHTHAGDRSTTKTFPYIGSPI